MKEHPGITEILSIINPGLEDWSWPPYRTSFKKSTEKCHWQFLHTGWTQVHPEWTAMSALRWLTRTKRGWRGTTEDWDVPRLSANGFSQQEVVLLFCEEKPEIKVLTRLIPSGCSGENHSTSPSRSLVFPASLVWTNIKPTSSCAMSPTFFCVFC